MPPEELTEVVVVVPDAASEPATSIRAGVDGDAADIALSLAPIGMGLDETPQNSIERARQELELCPHGDPSRMNKMHILAILLWTRYQGTQEEDLLEKSIVLQTEVCEMCPAGYAHRAAVYTNLAVLLMEQFRRTGKLSLLRETLELQREALSLQPANYPSRVIMVQNLAITLGRYFRLVSVDQVHLEEAIRLGREALQRRPRGHPNRGVLLSNLGEWISWRFQATQDIGLIEEGIALSREELLEPSSDHPRKRDVRKRIPSLLRVYCFQTGTLLLIDELLALGKEELAATFIDHPDRADVCEDLASTLQMHFKYSGSRSSLDEAIALQREALALKRAGGQDLVWASSGLAGLLRTRHGLTGDELLLDEALDLCRDALSVTPPGHSNRIALCGNLAALLQSRLKPATAEKTLLEILVLEKEALSLLPTDDPTRAVLCTNLVTTLASRYDPMDDSVFEEISALRREAESFWPDGNPNLASIYVHMASMIGERFERTGNPEELDEKIAHLKRALTMLPLNAPSRWRALHGLYHIYMNDQLGRLNPELGFEYLRQSISPMVDNLPNLLASVASCTRVIKIQLVPEQFYLIFLECFAAAIDLSSLVAGYVLDHASQLDYLYACQHLGPNACLLATLAGDSARGLELLERARGMMWSQALHLRDPQLHDAPSTHAARVEDLFRALAISSGGNASPPSKIPIDSAHLTAADVRHSIGARIHDIIEEIRSIPGHEGFMRGSTYKTLMKTAVHHPVVILVDAQQSFYAIVLQPLADIVQCISLTNVDMEKLLTLSGNTSMSQHRGTSSSEANIQRLGLKISETTQASPFRVLLRKTWTMIVQPIFQYLQLKVSIYFDYKWLKSNSSGG